MRLLALSVLLGSLSAPLFAMADEQSRYDIAGVRLGMTSEQAAAALAKHFHVPRAKITIQRGMFGNGGPPWAVIHEGKKAAVRADLKENPITRARLVDSITYTIPATAENRAALKKAAIEKYGPPSADAESDEPKWCAHPAENAGYCQGREELRINYDVMMGLRLMLLDPSRGQEARREVEKRLTTKPKL